MNEPTKDQEYTPVIHHKSRRVREIRWRNGTPGVWSKYLGWHAAKWANWEPLSREPLTGMREWYKLAGGMDG